MRSHALILCLPVICNPWIKDQSGYEPLNLADRSSVNWGNFDATELSFWSVGHVSFIYRASNLNKTSPRIVNIVENQGLVYYNGKNWNILALFQSHVVRSKQMDSLYIKAN